MTVKTLRHYDRLGLLRPAGVDPAAGYRHYSADQMPRLSRILALKEAGPRQTAPEDYITEVQVPVKKK